MDIDIFSLPIHPANAKALPMMTDADIDDMAADIKANGLIESITIAKVEGAWTIIDGKIRREACRRAGVVPSFEIFEGEDIAGLIIRKNLLRQSYTVGQLAIGRAMIEEGLL